MEITENKKRSEYNDDIKNLIKIFKFKNEKIELKGSANLANIDYFSDYDFLTMIKLNWSKDEIYDEFRKILRGIIENIDCYFIEFKLQNKNGTKNRWFPDEHFKSLDFNKLFNINIVDFCKIDIIYFSNNRFIEASSIYSFNKNTISINDEINELKQDIKVLKKENNYYKILKRLYSIYKLKGDVNKLLLLTDVFNSDLGEIYKNKSNIEAIDLINKYYLNDALTKKRIEINLDEINYNKNIFNKNKEKLNEKAKEIYNKL